MRQSISERIANWKVQHGVCCMWRDLASNGQQTIIVSIIAQDAIWGQGIDGCFELVSSSHANPCKLYRSKELETAQTKYLYQISVGQTLARPSELMRKLPCVKNQSAARTAAAKTAVPNRSRARALPNTPGFGCSVHPKQAHHHSQFAT